MSKVANYGLIILTWLYLENPNSNHIIEIQQLVVKWAPYWEVGNYLWHSFYLKNEKSTHKRISPFFLQTRSKFATHSEYLTTKMILAVKSLSNSLCMVASRVGLTSLCLWQTVESLALIGMACWIIPNQILLTLSKSKKNIVKLMKWARNCSFSWEEHEDEMYNNFGSFSIPILIVIASSILCLDSSLKYLCFGDSLEVKEFSTGFKPMGYFLVPS